MTLRHSASLSMTEIEQDRFKETTILEEGSIEFLDEPFTKQVGPYVLKRVIGDGSGGRVYLAHNKLNGELVAIKIILKTYPKKKIKQKTKEKNNFYFYDDDDETSDDETSDDETSEEEEEEEEEEENNNFMSKKKKIKQEDMARQENSILKRMNNEHKHIIKHFATYENPEKICLVMQYANGGDLFDLIRRKGRLDEATAWRIFKQLLSALSFVHGKGICHRDIKPENIFLDSSLNVLLGDFGHARTWNVLTSMKESCGSLCYSAPEVLVASRSYVGPEIDLWSCGTVLYVMITGQKPFWSSDNYEVYRKIKKGHFRRLPSFVSLDAADLIKKLLIVDPLKRAKLVDILEHPWLRKRPMTRARSTPAMSSPIPMSAPASMRNLPPLSPQRKREPHPLLILRKCGATSPPCPTSSPTFPFSSSLSLSTSSISSSSSTTTTTLSSSPLMLSSNLPSYELSPNRLITMDKINQELWELTNKQSSSSSTNNNNNNNTDITIKQTTVQTT